MNLHVTVVNLLIFLDNIYMPRFHRNLSTQDLISLSLYILIQKNEYSDITVQDICNKAHVSRMSFYRYFNNKDDILIAYCDQKFEEFFNTFTKKNNPTLEFFAFSIFDFFKKYERQLKILKKANKQQLLIDRFNSYANYLFSNIKSDNFHFNKSNPTLVPFFTGGLFNVLMSWIDNDLNPSPKDMSYYLIRVVSKQ